MTRTALTDQGRTAFAEHRWHDALAALAAADRDEGLDAADLERLSTTLLLLGRDREGIDVATRAHEAFLELQDWAGAARSATWIGVYLGGRGDDAMANGWFARARRIAETEPDAASAEALLLVADGLDRLYSGDAVGAASAFAAGYASGRRVRDPDATALAQLGEGQARIMLGESRGLALLDEAMVAVTAGEVSPVAAGVVYCSVIGSCHLAFDVRRA